MQKCSEIGINVGTHIFILPTWYSPFEKYVIHHMKICVYHAKPFNIHFETSAFFFI